MPEWDKVNADCFKESSMKRETKNKGSLGCLYLDLKFVQERSLYESYIFGEPHKSYIRTSGIGTDFSSERATDGKNRMSRIVETGSMLATTFMALHLNPEPAQTFGALLFLLYLTFAMSIWHVPVVVGCGIFRVGKFIKNNTAKEDSDFSVWAEKVEGAEDKVSEESSKNPYEQWKKYEREASWNYLLAERYLSTAERASHLFSWNDTKTTIVALLFFFVVASLLAQALYVLTAQYMFFLGGCAFLFLPWWKKFKKGQKTKTYGNVHVPVFDFVDSGLLMVRNLFFAVPDYPELVHRHIARKAIKHSW